MRVPTLVGARIVLRPPAARDAAMYAALHGDAAVMRHVAAPLSPDAAARAFAATLRLNDAEPTRRRTWMITLPGDDDAIGVIGIVIDDRDEGEGATGEIGAIVTMAWQSRGIVAEAIPLVAAHAFAALRLSAVETRHALDHAGAFGLMAKLGFTRGADDGRDGGPPVRWRLLRVDAPLTR